MTSGLSETFWRKNRVLFLRRRYDDFEGRATMGEKIIRAIVFDLDGVICSTDECHDEAWKVIADGEGIPFDKTVNDRLRGISRFDSLNILLEKAKRVYSEKEKADL